MKNQCAIGKKPRDDNAYFEQMSKAVFRSGFNWDVIEKKWPDFQKAFKAFSVEKVTQFDERDIDRLMQDPGIVRNYRKVIATYENARVFSDIGKSHGSFRKYLKAITADGEEALCRILIKRFSFLGGSTTLFFLRAVGEEMPQTTRLWEAQARKV